ncbi:hypothetical protein MSG28_003449 [Choristoneura fumiferana]|uniref:Uncharacterized protein n=3 Tax=Choristoneura fumiferana TaxID=7141 RepID=A0ACC0KG18_CHOFU|nr:hypothetical protein MSG28_003449 [Choristoneura fumiferana]KAI8435016.1 hypothetical protein MSG28_003449 [Choristoneura fumiferana]
MSMFRLAKAAENVLLPSIKYSRSLSVTLQKEPEQPCIKTSVPGPKTQQLLKELNAMQGSFHGRTFGALSTTRSKPIHKLDCPAFDWPVAPFPRYKYPLNENACENHLEDKRCLEKVADIIQRRRDGGRPVAGVLVEPIQSEGGDHEASPEFFQCLQQICKQSGVAFIVDEVQTGCGPTGKMWCHEHFQLTSPPDIVTFSKKMLTGGYFSLPEFRPAQGYRVFNTWMGDPGKLILLERVLKVIMQENLLATVGCTGLKLKEGLHQLENEFPNHINSVRGRGTFLAYNAPTTELRDKINNNLKKKGVLGGICGENAIRLRPALIFQPKHAEIYLDALRKTLKDL